MRARTITDERLEPQATPRPRVLDQECGYHLRLKQLDPVSRVSTVSKSAWSPLASHHLSQKETKWSRHMSVLENLDRVQTGGLAALHTSCCWRIHWMNSATKLRKGSSDNHLDGACTAIIIP